MVKKKFTGFPIDFLLGWIILIVSLFVDIWPVPTSLLSDPLLKQTVVKLHSNTNVPLMFVSRNELLNCETSSAYLNWLFVKSMLMKFEVGIYFSPSSCVFSDLSPFRDGIFKFWFLFLIIIQCSKFPYRIVVFNSG